MTYTFGPIPSRRFGMSLGIDLSSNVKQCNFDCLYCELAPAKTLNKQNISIDPEIIFQEVKSSLQKNPNIDVITFTANGEPTLYPYLDELVGKIDKIKGEKKTLILSNGANIYKEKIQNTLFKFDIVKLSLDCVSSHCFKKLDRQDQSVDCSKIIDGMIAFREKFKNTLILETLFVKDLNDKAEEIEKLIMAYNKIGANRIDLGTIDRPPAYDVKPITFNELEKIANRCINLPVTIACRERPKVQQSFSKKEILDLLSMRPLTLEDIENSFDANAQKIFYELLEECEIEKISVAEVAFYKRVKKY